MADEIVEGTAEEKPVEVVVEKKTLGFRAGYLAALTTVALGGATLSPVIVDGVYESEKAKLEVAALKDTASNAGTLRDHEITKYTLSAPDTITGERDTVSSDKVVIKIADPILNKHTGNVVGGRKYKTTFADAETDSVILIVITEPVTDGEAVVKTQIFPKNAE
jgi:hypothetical protein